MKSEELMIGDFVSITEPDDFHGYVGKVVNINGETCYITVHISDMHPHDVLCDDLLPIPLTPEILEKNGFFVDSNGIFYLKENLKFGFKKDIDYGYWFVNRADNHKEYICTCDFVHELQHALKFCKIEKEIIL